MKSIIVFIKQVPDTTDIKIDPETNTMIRKGLSCIINPFDMYALEQAIRIKEDNEGVTTYAVSMGPPQAETALREALSMGIDNAILLTDAKFAGSDTHATSYVLSRAAERIGDYSLILTGKQATDGDTAQVGPGISQWLDIPIITFVRKVNELTETNITVEKLVEDGFFKIDSTLPCVLSVVKELNEPRLPSFRGKMRARKAEIIKWGMDDIGAYIKYLGLKGSPTKVVRAFTPVYEKEGIIHNGDLQEGVERLFGKFHEHGIL